MTVSLKQEQHLEDTAIQDDQSVRFQDFEGIDSSNNKLNELIFFSRIALFGVSTVICSLFMLILNFTPLLAFFSAALISSLFIIAISIVIKALKN